MILNVKGCLIYKNINNFIVIKLNIKQIVIKLYSLKIKIFLIQTIINN